MKLFFIRHGKTEWNQQMRLQGKTGDSALLPESLDEIACLGDYLKQFEIETIYASPSLRARRTAEIINQRRELTLPIVYREGLREWGLGDLEGTLIEEARAKHPEAMTNFRSDLSQYNPSAFGGETVTQVLERFSRVVQIAMLENSGNVLFVSHGAALTAGINYLAGEPLHRLRNRGGLGNNTLSILNAEVFERPFTLEAWNDGAFLK
ncbi:MAG: histidine phosphatase family protein [Streptococcaceae bacterium]|jgi:probable phosphoglycerate mutase|nr:histidine phosphatase family protein [Streptococcaceae bacterium]